MVNIVPATSSWGRPACSRRPMSLGSGWCTRRCICDRIRNYSGPKDTGKNLLLDVSRGREIRGVATNVDVVRILVNTDVVDLHRGWESQVIKIDITEVPGHAQVDDKVLSGFMSKGMK